MATVDINNTALANIVNTKNQLLNEAQANYNSAVQGSEQKYNELIQASKDYGAKQSEIQQQKTDQNIKEINQQKDKTTRDYIREQKGAYTDYANQIDDYGVNAEKMASQGLTGSGYQESSKVSMYNTYQNRVALARQSYNDAIVQYDNQIAQAQIANSSALAEIAYNSLQTQLKLSLEGLQYKNELLNQLTNTKISVNSSYDNLWQSMYNTLLEESKFNEQMAYQKQRDAVADAQWQKQYQLQLAQRSGGSGRSSRSSSSKKSSGSGYTVKQTSGNNGGSQAQEKVSLSSAGNAILTMGQKSVAMGNFNSARGALANAYSRGQISDAEASYISKKLGI